MPYIEQAECPRCGKTANGRNAIERLFGYRTMPNGEIIPQSHCRECRSEEQKLRNNKKG